MRALAALFAEDAVFVDVAGQWFQGSAAIQAVLTARQSTVFKASRFMKQGVSVRFLQLDIAVVHATWELIGTLARDGQIQPRGRRIMTKVIRKTDGGWEIGRAPELRGRPTPICLGWTSESTSVRKSQRCSCGPPTTPIRGDRVPGAIPPRDVALPTSWRTGSTGWCPKRGRWCQRWRRSRARTA